MVLNTLKKNYEFSRIYKKGKFYVAKYLILYSLKNNLGCKRFGITASRKYGKSVKRNRIRRLIKESCRYYDRFVMNGYDFVFVARNNDTIPNYNDIRKEIKYLFKKLDVFDKEKWDLEKEFL